MSKCLVLCLYKWFKAFSFWVAHSYSIHFHHHHHHYNHHVMFLAIIMSSSCPLNAFAHLFNHMSLHTSVCWFNMHSKYLWFLLQFSFNYDIEYIEKFLVSGLKLPMESLAQFIKHTVEFFFPFRYISFVDL